MRCKAPAASQYTLIIIIKLLLWQMAWVYVGVCMCTRAPPKDSTNTVDYSSLHYTIYIAHFEHPALHVNNGRILTSSVT